jgi:hypothetical protein
MVAIRFRQGGHYPELGTHAMESLNSTKLLKQYDGDGSQLPSIMTVEDDLLVGRDQFCCSCQKAANLSQRLSVDGARLVANNSCRNSLTGPVRW